MATPLSQIRPFEAAPGARPDPDLAARDRRPPGQLIQLEPYRQRLVAVQRDAGVNADWDELLAAVREAWSWRDPESLMAVDLCVERLRAKVLADWGHPLRKG